MTVPVAPAPATHPWSLAAAFGGGPAVLDTTGMLSPGGRPPAGDVELVRQRLDVLGGDPTGLVRLHRPRPTAAFSRRDTTLPGHDRAVAVARDHGFEPVVRLAGGRLAAYHEGALVLDLIGSHPEPRRDTHVRFDAVAGAVVDALRELGLDADVGELEHEYCPGAHSVRVDGRAKLAGIAQRVTRFGYQVGVVLLVEDAEPVRAVLRDTYDALGLPLRGSTIGCVADEVPGVTIHEVAAALVDALHARSAVA